MEINERRTQPSGYGLKVGLAEYKVLAVNPTRQELNKLLGKEDSDEDHDIEYLGTNKENGNTTMRLTFWLQDVKTGFKTPITFFLENTDDVSQTGKLRYVNAVGASSYMDAEDNLQDWFKKAMTYRVAKKGECELMEFMRNWMTGIELNVDKGGNRNNILLEMSKLFRGNPTEMKDIANSEFAGTVVCLATIKSKQTEDGTKNYQNVYNRRFLPGNCIRYFTAKKGNKPAPRFVQKFVDEISGEYGPKDYFVVEELRDYREGENPVNTDQAVLNPVTPKY